MTDFLWHKTSEKEREEIKEQAKVMMDNFSKKLAKVSEVSEKMPEPLVERELAERIENNEGENSNSEFRKLMFENAPNKNEDFIIAEKKKW